MQKKPKGFQPGNKLGGQKSWRESFEEHGRQMTEYKGVKMTKRDAAAVGCYDLAINATSEQVRLNAIRFLAQHNDGVKVNLSASEPLRVLVAFEDPANLVNPDYEENEDGEETDESEDVDE